MNEPLLHGVCPIIATPFDQSGAIDYDSLRNEVRILCEGGCHAVALFGVVSEFFKLADAERDRLVEVVAAETDRTDTPLVLSVTHEATTIAVEWAQAYEAAGADCIMVLPPSTLDPPRGELIDHLTAIADVVTVPVMVQYRPPETPIIPPDELARLADETDTIRYFKIECSPAGPYISSLLDAAPDVNVLVGSAGKTMIEAFDRGACGVIPAAFAWDLYIDIFDAYRAGERDRAIELHDRLLPIVNHIGQASIPMEKEILARRGVIADGATRKPRTGLTDDALAGLLDHHYERLKPLLGDPK